MCEGYQTSCYFDYFYSTLGKFMTANRRIPFSFVFFSLVLMLNAQQKASAISNDQPKKQYFSFQPSAVVSFKDIQDPYSPNLMVREMPRQGGNKPSTPASPAQLKKTASATYTMPALKTGYSAFANGWGVSTPNDNDMAVNDSAIFISVINTNMLIRNSSTNQNVSKTLAGFTNPVNNFHREFDPKVIYDPENDRFALVTLVGAEDSTSKIVIGFTKTNDPFGQWNLYVLPGNPLNNHLWSDYPMIAMTKKELFLSINLLYNDSSWQTGFVETIVWQMRKDSGYAGKPLGSILHSNIKFNGKAIRNLCPVKGGSAFYGPNMYFLSNRNLAASNDSVFLVNITDTIGAPGLTVTAKVMKSPTPYIFPPDGRQSSATQSLATNDCRNLGAFYENGLIQYVHNTKNPANNLCSIYYGVISNPQGTPSVTGYILNNDSMDFAYPNISYSGVGPLDNSAVINFDHSSPKVFTGISAIQADGAGNFSPVLRIKNGLNYVDLLLSNLERWGDYSGSQRRYNRPGEVWMSGYYAYAYSAGYPKAHGAWVAQVFTNDSTHVGLANTTIEENNEMKVYPNPAPKRFSIEIKLNQPEYLNIELYDIQGRLITPLYRDLVKASVSDFSFNTETLSSGVYILKVTGSGRTQMQHRIVIE